MLIFTARKRSLGQGNVLSSVCQGFCPQGGGVHGRGACVAGGHAWQGGMHGGGGHVWQGACMAGGMRGRGHDAWLGEGDVHGRGGHVWQEACMVGGVHGRGHAWQGGMCGGGVHGGGMHARGVCMAGEACMVGGPPQALRLRYAVNERAVRILLECILVKVGPGTFFTLELESGRKGGSKTCTNHQ